MNQIVSKVGAPMINRDFLMSEDELEKEKIIKKDELYKCFINEKMSSYKINNQTFFDIRDINEQIKKSKKNYDFTNCKELYDKMQGDRYDAIREDKRFIAVLDKIKEYC